MMSKKHLAKEIYKIVIIHWYLLVLSHFLVKRWNFEVDTQIACLVMMMKSVVLWRHLISVQRGASKQRTVVPKLLVIGQVLKIKSHKNQRLPSLNPS